MRTCWAIAIALAVTALGCAGDDASDKAPTDGPCPATDEQLGCVACENGWHAGADGECRVDCPDTLEQDENGSCRVPVCPEGASELTWEEAGVARWTSCLAACPQGMVARGSGLERTCHLPCSGDWLEDNLGICRRACPAGMTSSGPDDACELDEVGERKTCPAGLYDESFSGPNPLYVDASSTAISPDGSKSAPFATIAEALDVAGDEVTIYLAGGAYHENVRSEGRSVVHLIGACAARVSVVADDPDRSAIRIAGANVATVSGVSVTSSGPAIGVDCVGVPDAAVLVANNRVERAGYSGIVTDECSAEVRDNTIRHAQWASIGSGDAQSNPAVHVAVTGNDIADMDACVASAACKDQAFGVLVVDVATADVSRNRLANLRNATGMALLSVEANVEENTIRSVTGDVGILFVSSDAESDVAVRRNVIADGGPAPVYGDGSPSFSGIGIYTPKESRAVIEANVVTDIRGAAIQAQGDGPLACRDNEVRGAFVGLWLNGDALVEGNRVEETRLALLAVDVPRVVARGNVFSNTVAGDFGLLPGSTLSNIDHDLETEGFNIGLSLSGTGTILEFEGNEVADCHGPAATMVVTLPASSDSADVVVLRDNVFRSNAGYDLYVEGGVRSVVAGNRFVGDFASEPPSASEPARYALLLGDGSSGSPKDMTATGNYFQDYGWGYALMVKSDDPGDVSRWTVDENSFVNGGLVSMAAGAGGQRAASFRGNHAALTVLDISGLEDVAVEQNALYASRVLISDTRGLLSIQNNVVLMGNLAVSQVAAPGVIANNEVSRGAGYGIAVASSSGPIQLFHNLVMDTENHTWEGVGDVGDGIHVVGTAELGVSNVEVLANLISRSARLGLLLSGATGAVDGNSFVSNGCGRDCQFVLQSGSGDVTGGDVSIASHPERPYGAITDEDL